MTLNITRLPILLLSVTLASCNQPLTVTPTTDGQQPAAPVTRIEGQVPPRVTDLHAQVGPLRSAGTVTPPAADANGTVNPGALATFAVPLPSPLPDPALTRFFELFDAPGCKRDVTGNLLTRVYLLSSLAGSDGSFTSVTALKQGTVTTGQAQVTYLYADRATYLRGTVACKLAGTADQLTGFELNLQSGWNRVVITQGVNGTAAPRLYATVPRITGNNVVAAEVWTPAP